MNIKRDEGDERDGKDLIPGSKFQIPEVIVFLAFILWTFA